MVNAYLIKGETGLILIDTGLPGTESSILKILQKHNLKMSDIKLIVITHAHVDHAGNASRLRDLTGAPIIAHRGDLVHYERQEDMKFCSTGLAGDIFYKLPLIHQPYTPFTPDILLDGDGQFSLTPYGINGTIIPTIGHTAGSLSITLPDTKEVIVADLIASGVFIGGMFCKHKAIRPPFEDDPRKVSAALISFLDAGFEYFHMTHGGPLSTREVKRHATKLLTL